MMTERNEQEKKALDPMQVRPDFPVLERQVHGKRLVYLDNAATSQTPISVIEAIDQFYRLDCSNIHRGVHYLSEQATTQYEKARESVSRYLNVPSSEQLILLRGATEALNLVAYAYGLDHLKAGDDVLISELEHHSNIVPWQMISERVGATVKVIPVNDRGELKLDVYRELLSKKTRIVAVNHTSNALGTNNPVKEMARLAHEVGAIIVVDGAQALPHKRVDVQDLDCDFYAFSAHKIYGPTGVGALYGKRELLDSMSPFQGGGDMIAEVTFEKTTYNDLPHKFEAGTPNIAGGIGLGAAVEYLEKVDIDRIALHEADLLAHATEELEKIEGLRMIGTAADKAAVCSFVMAGAHPHDIGTLLDREGVAIRTGHHCAQPLMKRFDVPATARASFGMYNTHEEVESLIKALHKVRSFFF